MLSLLNRLYSDRYLSGWLVLLLDLLVSLLSSGLALLVAGSILTSPCLSSFACGVWLCCSLCVS